DRVYRHLLARPETSLLARHRQALAARGLTDADIDRGVYRSLRAACRAGGVRPLRDWFGHQLVLSVPGIIARGGRHRRDLTLGGAPGLLIPIRSVEGHVVGLVVRPDDPGDGGKYRWVSSRAAGGPGPGARVHVPAGTSPGGRVILTEGPLKAATAA